MQDVVDKKNQQDNAAQDSKRLSEEYTQETFIKKWKEFAANEKKSRPRLSALLLSNLPVKIDEHIYRLQVESATVRDFLIKNVHSQLEDYMRNTLRNSLVEIRFEIDGEVRNNDSGLPYTSVEKYKYLLEKNPDLALLQKAFDLQAD